MNLGIKAEKAFVLWLQQQIPTATVYRGRRAQEIARPCVIVTAEDAQEAESKGGNYWYKLTITVSSEIQKADSTEADTASIDAHELLCKNVVEKINVESDTNDDYMIDAVSDMVSNFAVMMIIDKSFSSDREEHHWEDSFNAMILCANADIT